MSITELADACGLIHMKVLDPFNASTFAFGQILKSAAENPYVKKMIVCIGGSASTDGGVGGVGTSRCALSKYIREFD